MQKRVVQLLAHNPPALPEGGPNVERGLCEPPPVGRHHCSYPQCCGSPHLLTSPLWVPSSLFTRFKKIIRVFSYQIAF